MIRVVFMGTPEFAVPSLEALAARHDVVCAYSRPDAVSRRGSATVPTPVKVRALELGIPVSQPATLRDASQTAALSDLAPDIIVVAAYGLILPPEILEVPPFGCVNVHASLLPRWRGAAPVQAAILAGDAVTGVSIMRMEEGLDTGPYARSVEVPVAEMSAAELTDQLALRGAAALLEVVEALQKGTVEWVEQDDSKATYAPKIGKADVAVSPTMTVEEIVKRVRASGPAAPTRLVAAGRQLTVVSARASSFMAEPGMVECRGDFLVLGASDGGVEAVIVKPDGRHEMPGGAFARGLNLDVDATWKDLS
ncbi:MAG: methionyl-tRNA formyltransferase [Coriobacteriia bacterium]|nr:methionyl-tRNA formyltransferase [Coriobacteriia bacterium]